MVSYFTLGVALLVVFFLISNFGAIAGGVGWFFSVIAPFIYGLIIAYLLSIPCTAIQKLIGRVAFLRRFKRGISVVLIYATLVLLFYMTLQFILPRMFLSIADLVYQLPAHYQRFEAFVANINRDESFPFYLDLNELFLTLGVEHPMDLVTNWMTNLLSQDMILSHIGAIFSGAALIFRGLLAFISSIYFLFEMERLGSFIKRILAAFLSAKASGVILLYGSKINQYFRKYIFCLIIDCVAMAVAGTLLLMILGSPYALILGLLLGVMNFIPYFGSIFATIVAVIVVWVTQGFTMGVLSAVLLLIVQQLDANVLQPRLYGSGLKISPLLVIVSVTVGGAVGGAMGSAIGGAVMGMVVAIPIAKVLTSILDDVVTHRELEKSAARTDEQG